LDLSASAIEASIMAFFRAIRCLWRAFLSFTNYE
jgi:hypothetical protein